MTIHLITAENQNLYADLMTEHFRVRHDIYVRERGWKALARSDGLERDQFDDADTVYVLAEDQGRIVGGSRLRPSLKPHLLGEVFPHLAEGLGVPRGPDIYEWTRLFILKDRREGWKHGALPGQIVCGGLEYLLDEGVTAFSLILEMWWIPRFHEMGWKITPLGIPDLIENEWWVAAKVAVNAQMLESTRHFCDLPGRPILTRRGLRSRSPGARLKERGRRNGQHQQALLAADRRSPHGRSAGLGRVSSLRAPRA